MLVTSVLGDENAHGLLWFYQKPNVSGATIFSLPNVNYYDIGDDFSCHYYVRKRWADQFVTAFSLGMNQIGTSRYVVQSFNGMALQNKLMLIEQNVERFRLRDLGADVENSKVQLLVNTWYNSGLQGSFIYELPIDMASGVTMVSAHSCIGIEATSLDETNASNHFVSSGYDLADTYPHFIKYKSGVINAGCLPEIEAVAEERDWGYSPIKKKNTYSYVLMVPMETPLEYKEMLMKDDCHTVR